MSGPLGVIQKYNPLEYVNRKVGGAIADSPIGEFSNKIDPVTLIAGEDSSVGKASRRIRHQGPGAAADLALGV